MKIAASNIAFQDVDMEVVRRKVIKQKNKLKRERAKGRKGLLQERRAPTFIPIAEDE